MSKERPFHPPSHDRLTFFQEFLKHPLQIGSVIPSFRFLEQRLLKFSDLESAGTLVELGSGSGGTTQAILRSMAPTAPAAQYRSQSGVPLHDRPHHANACISLGETGQLTKRWPKGNRHDTP